MLDSILKNGEWVVGDYKNVPADKIYHILDLISKHNDKVYLTMKTPECYYTLCKVVRGMSGISFVAKNLKKGSYFSSVLTSRYGKKAVKEYRDLFSKLVSSKVSFDVYNSDNAVSSLGHTVSDLIDELLICYSFVSNDVRSSKYVTGYNDFKFFNLGVVFQEGYFRFYCYYAQEYVSGKTKTANAVNRDSRYRSSDEKFKAFYDKLDNADFSAQTIIDNVNNKDFHLTTNFGFEDVDREMVIAEETAWFHTEKYETLLDSVLKSNSNICFSVNDMCCMFVSSIGDGYERLSLVDTRKFKDYNSYNIRDFNAFDMVDSFFNGTTLSGAYSLAGLLPIFASAKEVYICYIDGRYDLLYKDGM